MATPFVRVDAEGRIIGGFEGKITDVQDYLAELRSGAISAPTSEIATHANGETIPGTLDNEDDGDMIEVELTAGQTYTWSYRGIVDPLLKLIGTDGTTVIAEDDDGGLGRTSQITFTATETGTYLLNATSWYQDDPTAPAFQDNGDYTIVQWSPEAGHDAGNNFATTATIEVGTNYGYLEAAFDQDFYTIELTEGMVYTFTYNGGVSSGTDWDDEPGESIGALALYDANGSEVVPFQVNYETGLTFVAQESGTYFVRAVPYSSFANVPGPEMTGGYTIDVREVALSDMDPLESLNWDSADNIPTVDVNGTPTAYIYFAPAGENFGELADDDESPMETFGWTPAQMDAVMHALQTHYTPITGIDYQITTNVEDATFRLLTTESANYGAYFYPQAEGTYGDAQGIGVFNLLSGGFGTRPESLEPGGFSYAVILHEFGHAHGIAHPHDTGGGSEVLLGVSGSTGSYGIFNLNQGVYTVMSYNDAWDFHPDGPTSEHPEGRIGAVIDHGWSETLGAFDIAVLQERYGAHDHNEGNDVYELTDDYTEASYKTIWDTDGTDSIAYSGELDAHIDLLAATLDYSPTGGGVISFLHNEEQRGNPAERYTTEIKGGYTIANGVVIENATGGSGDDVLLGNDAANTLTGNNGIDNLLGRGGNDALRGGNGDDVLNGGAGNDSLNGGRGNDLFVFEHAGTDTIVGYERGEKIDLAALGVTSDDVEVFGNRIHVELGEDDLTILFNTRNFSESDIVYGEPADAGSSAASTSAFDGAYNEETYSRALSLSAENYAQEYLL